MSGIISSLVIFVGMIGITNSPIVPVTVPITQTTCNEEEILWLARIVFSETKIVSEMPYIAWVVRNRVDTEYNGLTYKEVALHPNQFSGLNIGDKQYNMNISMNVHNQNKSWQSALRVATDVCNASTIERLFPETVRHFYSPRSINSSPTWATEKSLYHTIKSINGCADRFAFHKDVK